jgi:hypothetical protein
MPLTRPRYPLQEFLGYFFSYLSYGAFVRIPYQDAHKLSLYLTANKLRLVPCLFAVFFQDCHKKRSIRRPNKIFRNVSLSMLPLSSTMPLFLPVMSTYLSIFIIKNLTKNHLPYLPTFAGQPAGALIRFGVRCQRAGCTWGCDT